MNGQWIGTYSGSSEGKIIVNIDRRGMRYEGVAYLHENDPTMPNTLAMFQTNDLSHDFTVRADLLPIDRCTDMPTQWASLKELYDKVVDGFSSFADVKGVLEGDFLLLSWRSDLGVVGNARLPKSKAFEPSELRAREMCWEEYKAHVAGMLDAERRYLFRGQNGRWRLRTSYHRTGRANLVRYMVEDIQTLYKHLSARTKHVFNLDIPNENGAFYNLVQHHGYPTPLLDWTYSPYVAAFFAYRLVTPAESASSSVDDKVRILVLDQENWQELPQPLQLTAATAYFSIGEFLAIENERMIPQQAASTLTNIDDIESYIKSVELERGKTYLSAIDLPRRDRNKVIRELGYTGISAGSLFPGLDGACEELADRNFRCS